MSFLCKTFTHSAFVFLYTLFLNSEFVQRGFPSTSRCCSSENNFLFVCAVLFRVLGSFPARSFVIRRFVGTTSKFGTGMPLLVDNLVTLLCRMGVCYGTRRPKLCTIRVVGVPKHVIQCFVEVSVTSSVSVCLFANQHGALYLPTKLNGPKRGKMCCRVE